MSAVLYARRDAVADDLQQAVLVKADVAQGDPIGGIHPQDVDKAQEGADALREGGGKGGGAPAPAQTCHKQHIQTDINAGGDDEIVEGMAAVAHRVEDAHEHIVHHGEDGAYEVEAEILDGLREYLGGGIHPPQDGGGEGHTQHSERRTRRQAEGDGGVDGLAHHVVLLGAVGAGDHHAGTHRQAVEKADEHKDETAGGADRRQGVVVDVVAHAPSVKGVVQLLEQVPKQQWNGIQQHTLPNRALDQRLGTGRHGATPPFCQIVTSIAHSYGIVNDFHGQNGG